jgi:stage V sporulation protein AD
MPLEYGGQRPPSAQWTVTGAGAAVVAAAPAKAVIEKVIIGRIQDYSVKDANNMGAAMAPVDVKLTPYGNTVIIQDF